MKKLLIFVFAIVLITNTSLVHAADWPMVGANPQRTSWSPENIPLNLNTKWVIPFEPYISYETQVIGAANKVYVATSKGLYAFNADTGAPAWVFPTELPLGDAPTFSNGILYVGGFDKKVYAINAETGQSVWTFNSTAAFSTNPLVVNNIVYIGNRDGVMYGLNASNGQQIFSYPTYSPILQSAAFNNGKIYFTTLEGFAYALNSSNGQLAWKSAKLPGMGFHSWWPVVYQNTVILTRARFESGLRNIENNWLFTNKTEGNLPGTMLPSSQWITGQPTIDLKTNPFGSTLIDYIEQFRERRNVIVLNEATGTEITFNLDNDANLDGVPMLWTGGSGQLHPPIVSGYDNKLYFRTVNHASGAIPGALVSGWEYQTSKISYPMSEWAGISDDLPSDEQTGLSAAGSKIYWSLCCDRNAGAADLAMQNLSFPDKDATRQQRYILGNANPPAINLPAGYDAESHKFFWKPDTSAVYWAHSDNIGPTIYNGKLYMIRSNALIALSADGTGENAPILNKAPTQSVNNTATSLTTEALKTRLEQEVNKIVTAGHLKPAFVRLGLINNFSGSTLDDYFYDYWHNPADIHYFLLRAYPHLQASTQNLVKAYLQSEFANHSPINITHIGYQIGNQRDPYIYPPLDGSTFSESYLDAQSSSSPFTGWNYPPHNIYAIWRYAANNIGTQSASTLFSQIQGKLQPTIVGTKSNLTDAYLASMPHVHNAYIAGYKGYVELAKLAGQPQSVYQPYENELNRLMTLRKNNFTTYPTPNTSSEQANSYFYTSLPAWNFMYMTPELAEYLKTNASNTVLGVLNAYEQLNPNWHVALNTETQGENAFQPYQITHGLFQANAKIRGLDQASLTKYLDAPIVPTGDLYYIDNLVSAIESDGGTTPPPPTCTPKDGDLDNSGKITVLDLAAILGHYGKANIAGDLNCDGNVNKRDISIILGNLY